MAISFEKNVDRKPSFSRRDLNSRRISRIGDLLKAIPQKGKTLILGDINIYILLIKFSQVPA